MIFKTEKGDTGQLTLLLYTPWWSETWEAISTLPMSTLPTCVIFDPGKPKAGEKGNEQSNSFHSSLILNSAHKHEDIIDLQFIAEALLVIILLPTIQIHIMHETEFVFICFECCVVVMCLVPVVLIKNVMDPE